MKISRSRVRARVLLACAWVAIGAPSLRAQSPVLLQGIVDAEGWATDTNSTFLARNAGRPGALGRLVLWGALEPLRGLVLYANGESELGAASNSLNDASLDQAGLRYTRSRRLVVDAGKFPHVIGTFAARHFSTRNPLIGSPDAYPVQYPDGVQLSGATRILDYRVALVDLPVFHAGYTPEPDRAWRPALGVGITPIVGVRLGVSGMAGPYLNRDLTAAQLAQRDWRSYKQRVVAADLAVSAGYFELNAEAANASFDVPNRAEALSGLAYYVEGKYTPAARLYFAARLERNDYPFIMAFPGFWVARKTDFHNEEVGLGFRYTATTLLKASYRRDRWHVNGDNKAFVKPGGHAFGVQVSQTFDVMDWIERARLR
jgi:hypothetical protein